jgi:hypothetical protein
MMQYTDIKPTEISIVKEGAIDGTWMLAYGNSLPLKASRSGIESFLSYHNSHINNRVKMDPVKQENSAAQAGLSLAQFQEAMREAGLDPASFTTKEEMANSLSRLVQNGKRGEELAADMKAKQMQHLSQLFTDPHTGIGPAVAETLQLAPEKLKEFTDSYAEFTGREDSSKAVAFVEVVANAIGTFRTFNAKHAQQIEEHIQTKKKLVEAEEKLSKMSKAEQVGLQTAQERRVPKHVDTESKLNAYSNLLYQTVMSNSAATTTTTPAAPKANEIQMQNSAQEPTTVAEQMRSWYEEKVQNGGKLGWAAQPLA